MVCKCNKMIFGLSLGILLPLITSYLIYSLRYKGDYDFESFLKGLRYMKSLGKLISISTLPNLAIFMIVITYEKLLVARGLVIATFLYLIIVLIVRFLL